ncbi:MAG: DEAD/DEAH box helicase [Bacteroidia bacterium]|nr:DEAD/DEAH box helicase [Bacteroidia bacterium]
MGFTKATPIQEMAIPVILDNKDLIACAQTGTGKTAAYVLPILNKIVESDHSHLNTLILVPTRELAQQIDQQLEGFSYYIPVSSIPIYGGGDGATWDQQKKALHTGADIIVATPGRLISHLASGDIKFDKLEHLILDEADRMLDMGFYDDIIKIISYLPKERQTLMFSATMPPKIRTLANKILFKPEQISISLSKPAEGILQQAYLTYDAQKLPLISSIFTGKTYNTVIIFAGTKEKVKSLQFELKRIGLKAKSFHSDLEQKEREEIMNEFKNKKLQIIIGTDILSRGIDVEGVDLVLNFDVPPDPEDYIHRIGRTARAENTGTAITFINEKDQRRFHAIETLIERTIEKLPLPESLGAAPLYQPEKKSDRPFFKKRPAGDRPRPQGRPGLYNKKS